MTEMRSTEHALKYTWHGPPSEGARQLGHCTIMVIGVGGAGNNTVTRLTDMGATGVECVALNTDALHLTASRAHQKILIGEKLTKGLGVGGNPKLGRAAIEESRKQVEDLLDDVGIAFITAGLGGGTAAQPDGVIGPDDLYRGGRELGDVPDLHPADHPGPPGAHHEH
mgnify:CR=1 FL=1